MVNVSDAIVIMLCAPSIFGSRATGKTREIALSFYFKLVNGGCVDKSTISSLGEWVCVSGHF